MNHVGCSRQFFISSVILSACSVAALRAEPLTTVKAADIPQRVAIIGDLGQPLEKKLLKVQGVWEEDDGDKASSLFFKVTHVDGTRCKEAIKLPEYRVEPIRPRGNDVSATSKDWTWNAHALGRSHFPAPTKGEHWELLGYETGGFCGIPEAALKEFDASLEQPGPELGFVTRLVYIKVKRQQ
jgi:hypothetical protein